MLGALFFISAESHNLPRDPLLRQCYHKLVGPTIPTMDIHFDPLGPVFSIAKSLLECKHSKLRQIVTFYLTKKPVDFPVMLGNSWIIQYFVKL